MDENSLKTGLMAILAVSGSVVFIAMQAHNRLLSNVIKEIEFEINNSTGTARDEPKKRKKVRFAEPDDVAESTAEKAYEKKHPRWPAAASLRSSGENLDAMPQNWQVMYKEILQQKNIREYNYN